MPSGSHLPFPVDNNLNVSIKAGNSPSIDAFGRWRVSNPETIFDSKQIHDNQPLFFDDAQTSGAGTSSNHSLDEAATTISVGATTAGVRVRQTFQRFNYQPGKSQLILVTFSEFDTTSGLFKGVGLYDDDNGIFFESDGGTVGITRRTSVTGSAVDNTVTQSNWNLDVMDGSGGSNNPSGVNLNFSNAQIGIIDFEWLGVGRVRVGFVVDGMIYYCHEFLNANNLSVVYMSNPNLPIRYEIQNDGTGASDDFVHICSSVISEGGQEKNGVLLHDESGSVGPITTGNAYAILGLRLKSTDLDGVIELVKLSMISTTANDRVYWTLQLNPTIAGAFTYNNYTNSVLQVAKGAPANTVTSGTIIDGGYFVTAEPFSEEAENALKIGADISGTPDELVLCYEPLTANITVRGAMTWREFS